MCTLFNISPSPPVGTPFSVCAPLEPIKGRVRMLEHRFAEVSRTQKLSEVPETLRLTSNTTHSGRRVLRSGGLNHSKSLVCFPCSYAF
jgi:hypothetical protein